MYKKTTPILILTIVCLLSGWIHCQAAEVEALFSPLGGCGSRICKEIDSANDKLIIAAYQLTNARICDSIIRASQRKLDISVVVDRAMTKQPSPNLLNLLRNGVKVRTDRGEKIFHNKYIVIDNSVVITGSFNFSDNADLRNAENIVIIKDKAIADKFRLDFNRHYSHTIAFQVASATLKIEPRRLVDSSFNVLAHIEKEPLLWQK